MKNLLAFTSLFVLIFFLVSGVEAIFTKEPDVISSSDPCYETGDNASGSRTDRVDDRQRDR